MDIFSVITLFGGLAFFLYGMHLLSSSLEKMVGGKLERILRSMTSNRFKALLLGMGITIAIQSSSAMTVMLVGLAMGSTVLIESLFVIPGLGSVMMNGISNRDFMLVANGVLIISIFVAICNLVVDILYGIIDPRTR